MMELLLIFVGGVLGSSHCVGMCGGFALSLGAGAPHWLANLGKQITYSCGRIFTYGVAGGIFGYGGWRISRELPSIVQAQAVVSLVAGAFLIMQGLLAAGVVRWPRRGRPANPCLASGFLGPFLATPGWGNAFLAGVLTGFLPCGLVYAYLALATSAREVPAGAMRMAAFGLGTVPLMVLTGTGGSLLSLAARRQVYRAAAWCVVLTGALSVVRGFGFLNYAGFTDEIGCLLCH